LHRLFSPCRDRAHLAHRRLPPGARHASVAHSPLGLARACPDHSSVRHPAGLTTPNPVIVRSEALFDRPEIVRGVLRITRNPFFWGFGLLAAAHVIIIGDVAAMLAFGSVALLGIAGGGLLDAKKARKHGRAWEAFAAVTSDIPFLAIMQSRQRFAWREIGLWRIGLGLGVFITALALHRTLLGESLATE